MGSRRRGRTIVSVEKVRTAHAHICSRCLQRGSATEATGYRVAGWRPTGRESQWRTFEFSNEGATRASAQSRQQTHQRGNGHALVLSS